MSEVVDDGQDDLLSRFHDLAATQQLLADLHDDLPGKVSRYRQLADLCTALGSNGVWMPGGETTMAACLEARASFVHGNFMATILLCQGLAEHLLAAELDLELGGNPLPEKITFRDTISRCLKKGVISERDMQDFTRLMNLRNPLSHYRGINDPENLTRRVLNSQEPAESHLRGDASFAISMAVRLLSLPTFKLGG